MKYTIVYRNGHEVTRVVSKEEILELMKDTDVVSIREAGKPPDLGVFKQVDAPKRKARTKKNEVA